METYQVRMKCDEEWTPILAACPEYAAQDFAEWAYSQLECHRFGDEWTKLRLDLIPPEVIRALGEVLTFGAAKYGDRNWEQGLDPSRVYAALERHILAWREGEMLDPESGLPHLAHMLTNAGMLLTLAQRKGAKDGQ